MTKLGKLTPVPYDIETLSAKDVYLRLARMKRALSNWHQLVQGKAHIKVEAEDTEWFVELMIETDNLINGFEFVFEDSLEALEKIGGVIQ